MVCMPIPESETIDGMLRDVYTAQQQGLTLLTVDMGATAGCETLIQPRAEIHMEGENGVRSTVASIVLTSRRMRRAEAIARESNTAWRAAAGVRPPPS